MMEEIQPRLSPTRSSPWLPPAGQMLARVSQALLDWRRYSRVLLLASFFGLFLALVQFSTPDLPDNDGFYHIKMAYLMRTQGLKPEFPWLPLSILNPREFYDHHFLFHVALMPFTFGDLRLGAKWAAVLFASLAFLSAWNLLKNQRIPYASLWALGLAAVSEAFIYRMSITRAQSLSLVVLLVGLDWLLRKKYKRLALLAFVYVWLYDAFPLLLVFAGVYALAGWLLEKRLEVRPLVFTGLGIALGLVINPYFPYNIVFAVQHILPKLFEATAVSVGNEWYPYDTAQLLENSPLALAAFLSGTLALGLSGRRMDLRTAASFALACLFGLMLFQSRRFIEYFPPFSLVFAAFAWTPVFEKRRFSTGESHPSGRHLAAAGGRLSLWLASLRIRLQAGLPAWMLVIVLAPGLWSTFKASQESLQRSKPYGTYAGASAWLAANTPAGDRVFQTDWDDFPRLFYYNTHNTYLIGLDPTYMSIYDPDLYQLWVEITQGEVERPSEAIRREFGAGYILTDLRHGNFLEQAAADPALAEVYRDGEAVVFQIVEN
jgi:hypothetical protein